MTDQNPSSPIPPFFRMRTETPVRGTQIQNEQAFKLHALMKQMTEIHFAMKRTGSGHRESAREEHAAGRLPNFEIWDKILVARKEFHAVEKLSLCWRGPRRIVKALNDYLYQVEGIWNIELSYVHIGRLCTYFNRLLNTAAAMMNVIDTSTGIPVSRLMGLFKDEVELKIQICCPGFPDSEDTIDPTKLLSTTY